MMSMPLLVSSLAAHAARHAGDVEIVSRRIEGDTHRTNWRELDHRARRLAQALLALGCRSGDRVATLAWNGHRHLEAYYGTAGAGLVCHTINPRLFPGQIEWIANDAADRVLCFDPGFLPLVEQLAPRLSSVTHYVLMGGRGSMPAAPSLPGLLCYEDLLAAQDGDYRWPRLDENSAASICYTSGTTGNPKGAVYSHRSTVLHAYAAALPDAMALSATDTVLPAVPMFHVNAWGLPYVAALVGCKLVLPGPHLDGRSLHELFESEQVTFSAGVPTVWLGLINHLEAQGLRLGTLRRTLVGGAACPPALMRTLQDNYGVEVIHAWGMTEMSPAGTFARLRRKHLGLPREQQQRLLEKQGRVVFGVDMAVVDDAGRALPWDGRSAGDLVVRGPWVVERYFGQERSALVAVDGEDGWFPTGDVAHIDADGFMQITDRSKDVIKSGGEWISSIELENIAMAHPQVQEAAVIACASERWGERPLLVVVRRPGAAVGRDELLQFYQARVAEGRLARWQVPDDVAFVPDLPHTATGKIHKLRLREQFTGHRLPQ